MKIDKKSNRAGKIEERDHWKNRIYIPPSATAAVNSKILAYN
jgi:hypothetical protein